MYFHVYINLGNEDHYWWLNLDYDTLVQRVVIPYINNQVSSIMMGQERAMFNFASIAYVIIYKTHDRLNEEGFDFNSGNTPPELTDHECTQDIVDQFLLSKSPVQFKSVLQTLFTPTIPQVFVIMKFEDKYLDSAYEGTIKPLIKKFKYTPLRIDEVQDSGRITNQILEEIARSEIVLADLTGERPNCYYEAGFAHAIGKEMIFTIRKGDSIHFDLAGYRFIEWETEQNLRQELQKRLRAIKQKIK
jgi:hypothetical protein